MKLAHSVRALISFSAFTFATLGFAQQRGAARAGANTPPTYADIPGRPAAVMPSGPQLAAINAMNAAVESKVQAVTLARVAVLEASLTNSAGIRPLVDTLAAAELDLALARATELVRIQSAPTTRLSVSQLAQIPAISAAGNTPAAGRGGGTGLLPDDPNSVIQTLSGFRTEVVVAANRTIQGTWISIAEDDQGRIYLGANDGQPFTRLTLDSRGQVTRNEVIHTPISEAMGLTWMNNALYASAGRQGQLVEGKANPGNGASSLAGDMGLHRLSDPAGNGSFSKVETLLMLQGGEAGHGDHGVHDSALSPDGRHLYMINGNLVFQPVSISPNSPVRHNADDRIIPILPGGGVGFNETTTPTPGATQITGGGRGQSATAGALGRWGLGGWIGRMDLNGQDFHLFATGLRNSLHFDFNGDGEIFTYDSDHEPERGVPWYTPTRVLWLPSAANVGHRFNGSSKYPAWYEDATPPLFNIGMGSPVGVTFGYNAKFPAAYQKALFIADNNYGRIMAVHIKPLQSGYTVSGMDFFVYPKSLFGNGPATPHNITDMLVAKDGSFYYVVGNRGTQSYLMRVVYTGNQSTEKVSYANTEYAADRKLRHDLEAFHWTINDPRAVAAAWPHLGSDDRPLRYAARVALETVPASTWKDRALAETDAATSIEAMLALARIGGKESQEDVFRTLAKFPLTDLTDSLRIQKLRVIAVAISRSGRPGDAVAQRIIADVDSIFPAKNFEQNTEISQILAYFNAPTAAPKTMTLISRSTVYQENAAYRYNIRSVTTGWTLETRRAYFRWFNLNHNNDTFVDGYREWAERAGQRPSLAGNNFTPIRTAAMATLTEQERADPELAAILAGGQPAPANPFGP